MKYTKYLAILAAAFMMGSCSDDFLDKEPSENASEAKLKICLIKILQLFKHILQDITKICFLRKHSKVMMISD